MTTERDQKTKARLERQKSRELKEERTEMHAGDEILKTMLNMPPETHKELKEKNRPK